MEMKQGQWIPLEENPSEYIAKGIPKIGDPIRLDYDDKGQPNTGSIKRVGSSVEAAKDIAKCQEYGSDFIFSGVVL